MYVSRSLVFTIASLIIIICIIFIFNSNNTIKKQSSTDIIVNSSASSLQMIVVGQDATRIQSEPVFNTWEIADELWGEPRYYGSDVSFRDGVIDFKTPGLYQVIVDLNVIVYNDSHNDVPMEILVRIIQGSIQHRFEYAPQDVGNVTSQLYEFSPMSRTGVMIKCEGIVEITSSDIADGSNSAAPQYMIKIDESNQVVQLSSTRMTISRNDQLLRSRITVIKLN